MTVPSPEAITTSLSAMTCISAKPCQKRVGMVRRLRVVTQCCMARADRSRIERAHEIFARRQRGQARHLAQEPHLANRRVPGEVRPGPRRAKAHAIDPPTLRRGRVMRGPEEHF